MLQRLPAHLLSFSTLLCLLSTAQGANIAATSEPRALHAAAAPRTIHLTGMIEAGDVRTLRNVLTQMSTAAARDGGGPLTVELSSLGGDVYEALKLGYLFREFRVATVVRNGDVCLSACALAFLGGTSGSDPLDPLPDRNIELGGTVGFHSFSLNPQSPERPTPDDPVAGRLMGFDEARGGSAAVIRYTAKMDVDAGLIARMLGRPPDEFDYVDTVEDFASLNICPIGLRRPTTSPAEQAATLCNHATRWLDPAKPSQATAMTAAAARLRMLEHIQKNLLSLGVKGPLADQLASYAIMRNEAATAKLYADLKAAGLPLPELTGLIFEISGYRAGYYDMGCIVSLSPDDPDIYDLAIQGPKGMARAYSSAPPHCPRLFRYDRKLVINPHKD
ncbi:MAG: hypothetical protein ACHQK9_03340 [Reyranellales bacterium]